MGKSYLHTSIAKRISAHVLYSFRNSVLLLPLLLWGFMGWGQIAVTITGNTNTTPNLAASYTSFANFVTALNGVTAVSGPVTATLAAGTSETAPVKGFNISTSTANVFTTTNTLTIVKAAGAATTINAGVGTANGPISSPDGMLYLSGMDGVTIDGITFTDGNTTNATVTMEFGIALFKRSAGDGCNANTIQNCTFNMQRINNSTSGGGPITDGSCAIQVLNSTPSLATSSLTPTNGGTLATNGTNSNNRIYNNTINGGNAGIHLGGFAATVGVGPSPTATSFLGDINNDIGGSVSSTGNTILNFGGGATTNNAVGIRANNQWNISIQYNTINNNNGSGVNHATTLRGIFAQAATSASATISNNSVTVRSGATTSQLIAIDNGIGSTAASNTININNNTIRFSYTTATSGQFTGINNTSSAAAVNINNNNIQQLASTNYPSTSTASPARGINGGSPGGTLNIQDNVVSNFNMTSATTGQLYGITASTPVGLFTCTGNTIENLSYSTVGSTGSITGIYNLANATLQNWNNNIIRNFSTPGSGTLIGIQNNTTAGTFQCNNNQIYNFSTSAGGAGGFNARGITWSNANVTMTGNYIYSINSTGTTGGLTNVIVGIEFTGAATVSGNVIYDISSNSNNPDIDGIRINATGTNNVNNNLVGDLRAPNSTGNVSISGIEVASGTTNNIFHNTVNIAATTSSASTFGTSALYISSSTPVNNVRNNIFVNTSASGPTGGFAAALRYTAAPTSTNWPAANNNNLYFAGTPSATKLIYGETGTSTPTNPQQTIANYKTYINTTLPVAGREGASVSEDPLFTQTAGSNPANNFLKFSTSTALQLESGGGSGTGITTDFAGTTRNASNPDIGAWELAGIAADLTGPSISYTSIPNTLCTNGPSLSATITDASGVNTTTGTAPRLYYKKSGDANNYVGNTSADNGWKFVEASNTSSPFTFTLNGALLQSAITAGDVIQYFVTAQDNASTPNVGITSGTFTASPSSVALTSAAFPIGGTINSYTIVTPVATSVTIGASGTYTSITGTGGLFSAINAGGLSGNTVATIIDASVTETGAVALNQINYGCAGSVTLTIKPQTTATLTGSVASGALIKLNGADNVIIDGSNNGGTDKSLTITNSSTTSPCAVWISSTGAGAGATNNTVKNCIINVNSSLSTASTAISVSGSTINSAGADNDNIVIQNNTFNTPSTGVYANGSSSASSGGIDNLSVIGNTFATGSSSSSTLYGVRVGNALGASVASNSFNLTTSGGTAPVAISIETGVSGSSVNSNQITAVTATNTGGYGGRGITVGTGSASSNITIFNNFIAGVNGSNFTGFGNSSSAGIMIGTVGNSGTLSTTAGGINIFHNSINMSGSYSYAGACLTAGIYVGANASALDIRNNILTNSLNNTNGSGTASKNYALYSAVANTAFGSINYNDYFVSGTQGVLAFLGSDQTTLAALTTAFGGNANSVNIAPVFTSATDLHLVPGSNVSLNDLGTPLAAVTTDIDGTTRNATPDMGADEFTPPQDDASVTATVAGYCPGLQNVQVTLNNLGIVPLTSATINWSINGVAQTPLNWTGSIAAGSSQLITIGTFTFVSGVAYTLVATSSSPNGNTDSNSANDTYTSPSFQSALSGTYTVGVGGDFTTLTAAVAAANTNGICGPTVFSLIDATYGGETFPITINELVGSSSTNTLTIRPASGQTPSISGSISSSIIILNGADYVTIDGSNNGTSSRNLTITNTNTGTSSAVVWLQTAGTNGATNNTMKNCIVTGSGTTQTLFGIGSGSSTIATSSLGTDNDNNRFENNAVSNCQTAIFSVGASAANKNEGTIFSNNNLSTLGTAGIVSRFENNISVTGNIINDVSRGGSPDVVGISAGFAVDGFSTTTNGSGEVTNATITNNTIGTINNTGTFSSVGIALGTAASGSSLIANNMVSGVTGSGTGGDFIAGILVGGGGGSLNVYHNSVAMQGSATGTQVSACLASTASAAHNLDLRNNILSNTQSGGTNRYNAIALRFATPLTGVTSNYNDLNVGTESTTRRIGQTGSLTTGTTYTFATWQSTASQDANSVNIAPVFTSATDLHLVPASNATLNNLGTPLATVTTDIDGATRSSTPDMGADEFSLLPLCSTYTSPADLSTNLSQLGVTLSWAAATYATGYDVYFDQNPTPSTLVSPNQSGTTYNTGILAASTTYYWRIVPRNVDGEALGCNTVWSFTTEAAVPTLATNPTSLAFGSHCVGTTSTELSFNMNALNLTGSSVTITAPADFTVSEDNITFATTITVNHTAGSFSNKPIYVKFSPSVQAPYNANVAISDGGLSSNVTVTVTGTGINSVSGLSYTSSVVSYCSNNAITANNASLVVSGGTITYSVTPALPAGLSLSTTTGTITGTPTAVTVASDYTITATNACGSTSTIVNIEVIGSPSIPVTAAATNVSTYSFTANWTTNGSAAYLLDVATDASFTSLVTGYNGLNVGNVGTWDVTGLSASTSYWYRVRALDGNCPSPNSSSQTLTTSGVTSVATGDWNVGTTWVGGIVPTCSANVTILNTHTVTVNSAGNVSRNLTIDLGGTLVVSSGDLTVGCTLNNTPLANNGTLTVSGGILNVNGNVRLASGSTFNMSGSSQMRIDGNGNSSASSVPANTRIFQVSTALGTVNGGTITIVDPHFDLATTQTFGFNTTTDWNWSGNTLVLGEDISTDVSSSTRGFELDCYISTGILVLGNVIINGGSASNRWTTTANSTLNATCLQNLTINANSELRNTTNTYFSVEGNILNNGILSILNNLTLSQPSGSPVSVSQTISGVGIFRNSTTSSTASFNNLLVNNSNANGVTLSVPLSVSGTLTMTTGKINTTATNLLTLGTATSAGTLSYTAGQITGPFARTFASNSNTTFQNNASTLFPVGDGTNYLPINIDPVTTAGGPVVMRGQVFSTNTGTAGAGVANPLSNNRWEALNTSGSGNLTSCFIGLNDAAVTNNSIIVQASSAAGTYNTISPASTYVAGTPNALRTATAIASGSYSGYFTYSNRGPVITSFTPTSGCPNATVSITITGTDLSGPTSVTLNGEPCTIVSNTATQIVITTDASPEAGNIVVTTSANSATSPSAFSVFALPTVSASFNPSNVICSGGSTDITASGATTYSWSPASGLSATAGATVTATPSSSTAYVVTGTDGNGCTSTASASVTVNDPALVVNPPSNAVVLVNSNATFSVTATGTGLTYQWQESTDGGGSWANISDGGVYSGATTATLTLTNVTTQDGYQYRVIITGTAPCGSVTSTGATLTISPTSIDQQPQNQMVCTTNGVASFSIVTSGAVPTYQWQVSTDGGATWNNVPGETTSTLNLSSLTIASNGYLYRCQLNGAINSNAGTLNVYDPPAISTQPVDLTVCSNATSGSISVAATGSNLTYQWQESTDGGVTWSNVSGATASTLTFTSYTNAMNGNKYQVIVSGSSPCVSVTSNAVTLNVNGVTISPSSTTVCLGNPVTLTAQPTSNSSGWSYSWSSTAGSGASTPLTGSPVDITATTSGSYTYVLSATNSICTSPVSVNQAVTVSPVSVAGTATAGTSTFCQSGSTTITLSGNTGTIQWQSSTDNITFNNIPSATSTTLATGTITSTTYYRAIVTNSVCSGAQSNTVTVTVNDPQILTTTPAAICGTGTATLAATGTPGSTLNWYAAASGGTALGTGTSFTTPTISSTTDYYVESTLGTTISNANGGRIAPASTSNTTAGGSGWGLVFDATTSFTLNTVDVYNAGSAGSMVIELRNSANTVLQTLTTPVIPAGNGTVPTTVTLGWTIPVGTGYRLVTTSSPSLVREFGSAGVTYALGTVGSITSGFISGTSTTYYYFYNWNFTQIVPCASSRTIVTATVNAAPPITASASSSTLCIGQSTNLSVTSANTGYSYTWDNGAGSGNSVSVTPSSSTTYTVTASDNSGGANNGCAITSSVAITVNPNPDNVSANASVSIICPTTAIDLNSNSVNNITLLQEGFNDPTNNWTTTNTSTGGTPSLAAWALQPDSYIYGTQTFQSNDNTQFYLSNSDNQGSGGTTATTLVSPVFSTVGLSSANLSFFHYYRFNSGASDRAFVDISTDGSNWTNLVTYNSTQGTANSFANPTIPLDAYLNQPTVYVRFRYGATFDWYWAIDNVLISGEPSVSYAWTSTPAGYTSNLQNPTGVVPEVTTTYTVTATNSYNCSATATTSVTLDNIAPVPTQATLTDVTAECSVTALTSPSATDNCAATVLVTNNATLPITSQGTTVVTWTYDDGNGNTTTQTQNIIIDDVTAPVTPNIADATGECSVTVTAPTTTDNCAGTIAGTTTAPLTYTAQGTYSITWSFDDNNGNVTTATQTVVVDDVTAPATPVLANVTGECSATAVAPSTTDNCSGTITGTTTDPLTYNTQGTYTITWSFDDNNGNVTTATQTVVLDDVTAPAIPTIAAATGECSVTVVAPTTTDNCTGTITGTTTAPLTYTAQGAYSITWTFDDGNGNSTTATQSVVVDDVTAPVTPIIPAATGECSVTVTAPTTTDNCAGTITGTTSTSFPITTQGTTLVTWTFDDGNGNSTTAIQSVVVDDVTAPTTPLLANVTGECSVTVVAPTTTDNCAGTITGTTTAPLTYNTQGTYTITWSFDDNNGNVTTATQTVIVDDVTAPATPLLANITGECSVTVVAPTTTDNCAGSITGTTTDPLTYNTQGTYTITWSFDDNNGNVTTATQTVVVDDVTAPATPTIAAATGECSVTVVAPTTTDNCAGTITGSTSAPLTYAAQGTYSIIWTFDDGNGNSTTATQSIVVDDVTAPVAPVLSDVTAQCSVSSLPSPTATDNCSGTITGTTTTSFPITTQGTTVVTWTFNDGNGQTATTTQNVIILGSSSNNVITSTSCGNYVSGAGNVYTASGTYTENLVSATGCDSIVTLNLTIYQTFTIQMTALACKEYTVPSGTATYNTSGVYNDTLSTVNGCDSILVIQLTVLQVDNTVTQNGITLTANAVGAEYQWINCTTGVEIWNATGQSFTPIYNGTYAVVIFQNGCYDTSMCYTINSADLKDKDWSREISVYPNPSTGIFTLEANDLINTPISLYDMNGRLIKELLILEDKTLIDLRDKERGVYFIRIEDQMIRLIVN